MLYLSHKPSPPLHLAVEAIWLYAGYHPPHQLERVLPSGTIEWVINLREDIFRCYHQETFQPIDDQPGMLIAGPRSRVQVIDTEQQAEIMGVQLKPGGLRYLTPESAREFADLDVPLEAIWGSDATQLREELVAAPSPWAKVLRLEHFLVQRMNLDRAPHPAVAEALRRLEPSELPWKQADLADDLGLSSRRFIEVFTTSIGLTPKVYARIRRFQKALGTIHRRQHRSWADLAFDCGWYDQAHMIRDFKQFSGLTPSQYESLNGEFMLHVPIEERGQICPIPDAQPVAGFLR